VVYRCTIEAIWNMIKIISGGVDVLIGTPIKLNEVYDCWF
jgi:hypothetical protein